MNSPPGQRSKDQVGERPARRYQTRVRAAFEMHRGEHERPPTRGYAYASVSKPLVDKVRDHGGNNGDRSDGQ